MNNKVIIQFINEGAKQNVELEIPINITAIREEKVIGREIASSAAESRKQTQRNTIAFTVPVNSHFINITASKAPQSSPARIPRTTETGIFTNRITDTSPPCTREVKVLNSTIT